MGERKTDHLIELKLQPQFEQTEKKETARVIRTADELLSYLKEKYPPGSEIIASQIIRESGADFPYEGHTSMKRFVQSLVNELIGRGELEQVQIYSKNPVGVLPNRENK
jgi:hypothetical protein